MRADRICIAPRARLLGLIGCVLLLGGCPNTSGISCPAPLIDCNGTCVEVAFDPKHCGGCGMACGANQLCSSGTCSDHCGANLTQCDGLCVDSQHDPGNCGSCGTRCAKDFFCVSGSCQLGCPATLTICPGDLCVDKMNDPFNCGACGVKCGATEICCSGMCLTANTSEHCGSCAPCLTSGDFCFDYMGMGFICMAG
jgi:Stigma-specific protein, Stig1